MASIVKNGKMKAYLFKNPWLFTCYIIALFFNQGVIISVALFLRYVLDAITAMNKGELTTAAFVGLTYIIVLFLVEWIRRRISARYMYKTMLKLKSDVFSNILETKVSDFNRANSAQYISVMNNDIALVETNYFNAFFTVVQFTMSLIFAIAALILLNPFVAAITSVLSIAPLSVPKLFGKKLGTLQGKYVGLLGKFTEKVKDFLEGFEVIKTFSVEKNAKESFMQIADKSENGKYCFNKANADVNAFANMLSVGVQFAIFLVSGYFVLRGDLTVGAIVAVTQLSGNVISPIMQITQQRALMKSVSPVNERILSVVTPNSLKSKDKTLCSLDEKISVKNLTFSYDGAKNSLNNVTYTFKKSGKYAIVGGSGSGKSTMLRLLMGYYDNYNGEARIDDTEINEINPDGLYNVMTMMHQNVFLFDDTLRNNITLYNQYSDSDFNSAVEKAGLNNVVSNLSDKALALVGESGKTLSGGERQRVAIARAIIKGCDVLIMDEATANLDNETAYDIEKSLIDTPNLTCIFVTHRYTKELLRKCDGILVMRDGELVESGNFDDLYDEKGYFYSLYTVTER